MKLVSLKIQTGTSVMIRRVNGSSTKDRRQTKSFCSMAQRRMELWESIMVVSILGALSMADYMEEELILQMILQNLINIQDNAPNLKK
jgi:hypothetical protein